MPKAKDQISTDLKEMFSRHYFPQVTKELNRFSKQAYQQQATALGLSEICGLPIATNHGYFRIQKPTEDLIDKIADYVLEEKPK